MRLLPEETVVERQLQSIGLWTQLHGCRALLHLVRIEMQLQEGRLEVMALMPTLLKQALSHLQEC